MVVGDIYDFMAIWKQWYRGNVNDFHWYDIKKVDGTTAQKERKTLNMPKKLCEDFSKLIYSENVEIRLDKVKSTKKLLEVLGSKENDFETNFPIFLEKLHALGTMVTVEYKKDNKTIIDYIDGDVILPYKYTNSYINGIITVSRETEGTGNKQKFYTRLTYHEYLNGTYITTNQLYVSKNENSLGKEISFSERYPNVKETDIIFTNAPRFQVWRLPIANNFNTDGPMGLSILANQLDKFKSIDIKYDSFDHEFVSGKRRVMVSKSAVKGSVVGTDEEGKPIMVSYFDSDDDVYVAINGLDEQPVKDINFQIRADDHIKAINAELNYLSSGVGLGTNYYKFDGQSVKTATEVISSNSDTYRTKVHFQNAIYKNLEDLIKAICEMESISYTTVSINPDDSIIEDSDKIRQQAMSEYNSKLISKAEYYRKVYKMKDEEAIEFSKNMKTEIENETITDGSELNLIE